jgi:hypothetical protein
MNSRVGPQGSRIDNEAWRKAISNGFSLLTDANQVVRVVLPRHIPHPGNPQHRQDRPQPKQSAREVAARLAAMPERGD